MSSRDARPVAPVRANSAPAALRHSVARKREAGNGLGTLQKTEAPASDLEAGVLAKRCQPMLRVQGRLGGLRDHPGWWLVPELKTGKYKAGGPTPLWLT